MNAFRRQSPTIIFGFRSKKKCCSEGGEQFNLAWTPLCSKSIVVEDLISVLQDCVDDPYLPTSIRHIRACAHKSWPTEIVSSFSSTSQPGTEPENNGQVPCIHPSHSRVLLYSIQMLFRSAF